jgi:hypothetical protein
MLSPRRDDLDMKRTEDVSIARRHQVPRRYDARKGGEERGRVDVHLTPAEAMLLADEFGISGQRRAPAGI